MIAARLDAPLEDVFYACEVEDHALLRAAIDRLHLAAGEDDGAIGMAVQAAAGAVGVRQRVGGVEGELFGERGVGHGVLERRRALGAAKWR